jgi:SRSO17 transposase
MAWFRVVVADSFYGEDEGFRMEPRELEVSYLLASKPSHSLWHRERSVPCGRRRWRPVRESEKPDRWWRSSALPEVGTQRVGGRWKERRVCIDYKSRCARWEP